MLGTQEEVWQQIYVLGGLGLGMAITLDRTFFFHAAAGALTVIICYTSIAFRNTALAKHAFLHHFCIFRRDGQRRTSGKGIGLQLYLPWRLWASLLGRRSQY